MTPSSEQRDDLISRHLDGLLSDEETLVLKRMVEEDAEAAQALALALCIHASLVSKLDPDAGFRDLTDTVMGKIREAGQPSSRPARAFFSRTWRRPLALAAAAAVLAVTGVWWMNEGRVLRGKGGVSSVKGGVVAKVAEKVSGVRCSAFAPGATADRQMSGGGWTELAVGDTVRAGTRIETGEKGRVKLAWLNQPTTVQLEGNSSLDTRLPAVASGAKAGHLTLLFLERGKLAAVVAKQPEGMPFVVETPQARATVLGTRFMLQVGADRTQLEVEEGNVRLTRLADGASVEVPAGQGAVVAAGVDLVTAPSGGPAKPGLSGAVVFLREFAAIPAGEETSNQLVRLRETGGEVTAIISKPYDGWKSETWRPDQHIEYFGAADDAGAEQPIFTIPKAMEIRIRIKAEKPGRWNPTLAPTQPRFSPEHFYTGYLDVGTEWREVVIRPGDQPADLKPYRPSGQEKVARSIEPGVQIRRIGIYGYGTGRLFVDRFEVVSRAGNGD